MNLPENQDYFKTDNNICASVKGTHIYYIVHLKTA